MKFALDTDCCREKAGRIPRKTTDAHQLHDGGQDKADQQRRQVALIKGQQGVPNGKHQEAYAGRARIAAAFGVIDNNGAAAAQVKEEDMEALKVKGEILRAKEIGIAQDQGAAHEQKKYDSEG